MKVFAFNNPYQDVFDPYLVVAETKEEAINKIREAYPTRHFQILQMVEIKYPGLSGKRIKGIYTLECLGESI